LELEEIEESCKRPDFWKLNDSSLLARRDYVQIISRELHWLEDAKDLSDERTKYDWLKYKIKTSSINYSQQLSKGRQRREKELNSKYQDMLKKLQNNPSETTRLD